MFCVVLSIHVLLTDKIASIECSDNTVIKTAVIVGKKSTPTPKGSFTCYNIWSDQTNYFKNGCEFKLHADGSQYVIHANDKHLPQNGSLGCIRIKDRNIYNNLKFTTQTKVNIN